MKWGERPNSRFGLRPGARPLLLAGLFIGLTIGTGLCGETSKMLKVVTRQTDGITHFFVENLEVADVTTTFEIQLENLRPSTNFPFTTTIPGGQSVEAFSLAPINADAPWDYKFSECFTMGNMNAVHDDNYIYALPYAAGKSYRVSQGYHGTFSHSGPDEFAIDWKMPVGTPVHAARAGVVVKCKDDSDQGGPDRKYESNANCVMIQHSDGTIGIYAHLQKGGAKVKVGDHVRAGDLIALSGNTGYTSGPHLHFSVFKTRSGKERESLPIKFQSADHGALTLVNGHSYKAAVVEDHVGTTDSTVTGIGQPQKRAGG